MAIGSVAWLRNLECRFFPAGDVLLLFAVVGLVLFLVRKWSDKAILITAIILLIQPIEWYHYIMSLLNPAHALPDLGVGAMYSEVAEYTKAGNFLDFIWGNITLGQKQVCTGLSEPDVFCRRQVYSWWDFISAEKNYSLQAKHTCVFG